MYQSEWSDSEVLHLLPHWNWKQGDMIDVWCYYNNAEEVELFLNGRSLGRRSKTDELLHAAWKVPFEAGELKVVKLKDGLVVQEAVKRTAGAAIDLEVDVEHERFTVDNENDLYFLTVALVDKDGNLVPDNDRKLSFTSISNVEILGTDNGYQADLNSLSKTERDTYKGLLVAVVKKQEVTKKATIKIKSNTMEKEIVIQ